MKVRCKLKKLMAEVDPNLPQSRIAEETGLSPTTIRKLYRNEFARIDNDTTTTLSRYFGQKLNRPIQINDLYEIDFEGEFPNSVTTDLTPIKSKQRSHSVDSDEGDHPKLRLVA